MIKRFQLLKADGTPATEWEHSEFLLRKNSLDRKISLRSIFYFLLLGLISIGYCLYYLTIETPDLGAQIRFVFGLSMGITSLIYVGYRLSKLP